MDRYKIYLAGGILSDQSRNTSTNLSKTHLYEYRILKVRSSAQTATVQDLDGFSQERWNQIAQYSRFTIVLHS